MIVQKTGNILTALLLTSDTFLNQTNRLKEVWSQTGLKVFLNCVYGNKRD